MEWRDSLHIPHMGWMVRGVSLNASENVGFYSSLLSTLDIATAIYGPDRTVAPIPYGRVTTLLSRTCCTPVTARLYLQPQWLQLASSTCGPWLSPVTAHLPHGLRDVRSKGYRHHAAWKVRSQWIRESTPLEVSKGRAPRRPSTEVITESTVRGAQLIWIPAA